MEPASESSSINYCTLLTRDAWQHVFSYIRLFPRLNVLALVSRNLHALVVETITDFDGLVPTQAFLERHLSRLTSLTALNALPVLNDLRDWSTVPPLLQLTHLELIEHFSPTFDAWTLRLPSLASLSLPDGVVPHLDALAARATGLMCLKLELSSHLSRRHSAHIADLLLLPGGAYPGRARHCLSSCPPSGAAGHAGALGAPPLSLFPLFPSLTELHYQDYIPEEAFDVWAKCAPLLVHVDNSITAPPLPRLETFADRAIDNYYAPLVVAFLAAHSTSLHHLDLRAAPEDRVPHFPPCPSLGSAH